LLSAEIESVVESRIADDIETVISRNPPTETIREVVADVLHSEGVTSEPLPVDRGSHGDLIGVIKAAPSREWVDNFLNLVAELIEITEITADDEQLVMSIRTNQKSLPISLGNRYCLKGYLKDEKLGVILPHGSAAVDELQKKGSVQANSVGMRTRHIGTHSQLPRPMTLRWENTTGIGSGL